MLARLITMTVLLWAVMGCANQTTVEVHHKVTTPDGVITETDFKGEALPRSAEQMYLKWRDTVELNIGNSVVIQPDYKGIIKEIMPAVEAALCTSNPLNCPAGDSQ